MPRRRHSINTYEDVELTLLCQLMVVGANSMPTGIIPKLGYYVKQNFIQYKCCSCDTAWLGSSSIVLQLDYEAVQLWKSTAMRWTWARWPLGRAALLCPALFHTNLLCTNLVWSTLLCSILLWFSETSSVFQLQTRKHSLFSWLERESSLSEPDQCWPVILTEILSLTGPKGIVLLGQNGTAQSGWWRCRWG